jgi:hypothetical protein
MFLNALRRTAVVLAVSVALASATFCQSPPIRPGYVQIDDEIVPEEVLLGDATWYAIAWPGGVVPFDFAASVNAQNQSRAADAMADVAAVANVTFVPRTTEPNWVRIHAGTSNSSYVGMNLGMQPLTVVSWGSRYVIVHELIHALGFWHEHQRPDRDSYVTINWANIQGSYAYNFNLLAPAATVGAYDFDSVMHYPACAFSLDCPPGSTCTCSNVAISALPPYASSQGSMGQRQHLSLGDAAGLASYYGAPVAPTVTAVAPASWPANLTVTITIDGTRFCRGSLDGQGVLGTSVTWDGSPLATTYISPTRLVAVVPPSLNTLGSHAIVATNPAPGAGPSTPFGFTTTPPAIVALPAVQSVSVGGAYTLDVHGPAGAPVSIMIDTVAIGAPVPPFGVLGVPFPPALIFDGIGIGGPGSFPIPLAIPPGGVLPFVIAPMPPLIGLVFYAQAVAVDASFAGGISLSAHDQSRPTPACQATIVP